LADGLGRTVSRENIQNGQAHTVSTANLPSGLYFWRLVAGGRLVAQGKVVVSQR
jgi:hypothetical protein